jgi:putative heme-binding domain-containing protein
MGPDLTDIGTRRGPENLRQSLLDPEAEVPDSFAVYRRVIFMPDNFLQVRLTTRDGRRISGVRVNEDAFTIQIREASDRIDSFRKDDLLELHKDWGKSPMPGYRGVLSDVEIQDVVAYLASLQGTP